MGISRNLYGTVPTVLALSVAFDFLLFAKKGSFHA
jgi:hypothetical protein